MNKNIGEKIIEFLKEKSDKDFPKSGVIAGQSVAEAYFRIMDIPIKTRIKDIDIFHSSEITLNKIKEFKENKSRAGIVIHGDQQLICEDGSFGLEIRSGVDKTVILKTVEVGKLNLILIDISNAESGELTKHVVDGFDINSVQIAVDIRTKKLYKTSHFDEFVKNKQLMIVNYCSPVTSLFRLLEKHNSYEGAYLNKAYELNLVAMKSLLFNASNYHRGKGMTPNRYEDFSCSTKSFIESYFKKNKLELRSWHPSNKLSNLYNEQEEQDEKYFNLITFDIDDGKIDKNIVENVKNINSYYEKNGFKSCPKSYFNYFDRELLIKLTRKGFVQKFLERVELNNFTLENQRFINNVYSEKINDINKCTSHRTFSLLLVSKGYKLNHIADFIRLVEKNNLTHLIGSIENGSLDVDVIKMPLIEIEKIYQEQLKNLNKNYKYSFEFDLSKKYNMNIEQIKSNIVLTKLGNDMGHCVGGYWTRVSTGKCFIFDIVKDLKNNERWTVAYNRTKTKAGKTAVKIEQVQGKYNSSAPKDIRVMCKDIEKDLTKFINDGNAFVEIEI